MLGEGLTFLKYPTFHDLAERQGEELGSSYKSNDCAFCLLHSRSSEKQFSTDYF